MNSRERLLGCIKHQPIDRVPISTYELVGWNENAWENNEKSYKKVMDNVREYTDCIYMMNPGIREVPNAAFKTEEWKEGKSSFLKKTFQTSKGMLSSLQRTDEGVHTTWTLEHLLKDIGDIDKYISLPFEEPQLGMNHFFEEKKKLGDKGLMMMSVDDPICLGAELFEMSNFLIYAITEPEKIKFFLDAIHERQMQGLKEILKHNVKDIIFRICGPEYATPPYLPPECYYNFVTCYLIEICRAIKEAGGIPRIHSHGKIGKVIDQFALTEAEAIDPVEPPPDGDMELADIKKLYGDKFCIMGNIELKELEISDTKRIDLLVKNAMNDAKSGSGFVLMPTASPINVPLSEKTSDNYLKMIESAIKYGKY